MLKLKFMVKVKRKVEMGLDMKWHHVVHCNLIRLKEHPGMVPMHPDRQGQTGVGTEKDNEYGGRFERQVL